MMEKAELQCIADASLPKHIAFTFPQGMSNQLEDERRGSCVLFAALMRERYAELEFDSLRQIVFTTDVMKTVFELECVVGRALPAARNGAELMPLFAVEIGGANLMIIRDEWFDLVSKDTQKMERAYWLYASVLATIDFYARIRLKFLTDPWYLAINPFDRRRFDFGRDMLSSYWQGFFGYHQSAQSEAAFEQMEESFVDELRRIDAAISQFADDGDMDTYDANLQTCVTFLSKAMAVVIGYTDAAEKPLELASLRLWSMVQRVHLDGYWVELMAAIVHVFTTRANWVSAQEFLPIGDVGLGLLRRFGIRYHLDGETVVAEIAPAVETKLH